MRRSRLRKLWLRSSLIVLQPSERGRDVGSAFAMPTARRVFGESGFRPIVKAKSRRPISSSPSPCRRYAPTTQAEAPAWGEVGFSPTDPSYLPQRFTTALVTASRTASCRIAHWK
jgi:hypothetical protein